MDLLTTSAMIYGLAIETGLKGRILSGHEINADVMLDVDEDGNPLAASLRFHGDPHDLERLAVEAGVVSPNGDPEIRHVLRRLTDCVKWIGRYAVPKSVSPKNRQNGKVPMIYANVSIRDYIDSASVDPDVLDTFEYLRTHTFFIRAVDKEGVRSKAAYRSFTANNLSPVVAIETPRSCGPRFPVPESSIMKISLG